MTFDSFGFEPSILKGVKDAGYTTPTPVQAATLPIGLKGIDVVGVAQTGTGKTAAFVLPILDYLVKEPSRGKRRPIRALVVAPTRELAIQVTEAAAKYGKHTGLRVATIYGGVGKGKQRTALRNGVDIVVATPGRLLDFLGEGALDLGFVDILVLDEADRMFDMGFVKDVRRIVAAVPEQRQTMLFSATMPPPIQDLAKSILYKPETVEVGERRDPAATVTQRAIRIAEAQKQDLLHHLIDTEDVDRMIVFSRTKYRADRIRKKLDRAGFDAIAIHSNRSQGQRQRALKGFEAGEYQIMVATDIAARGIDVPGVSHVINFDTPNIPEDYIHRIGRTGRAESTGDAISFISAAENANLKAIEKHTGRQIKQVTVDGFDAPTMAEAMANPKKRSNPRGHKSRSKQSGGDGRKGNSRGGNRNSRRG
ncbi:DEAD/DEAH box helicase [Rubrivirga sp.]|uniref:DEAD/DEAH box helicase n=1 Tax=Rubrivirga sp. TaxID=1885344 RepID=UPI003C722922